FACAGAGSVSVHPTWRWRARFMTEREKHTMMDAESVAGHAFSRRSALKRTAGVSMLLGSTMYFEQFPRPSAARAAPAASSSASFSDIQHDLGAFFAAA